MFNYEEAFGLAEDSVNASTYDSVEYGYSNSSNLGESLEDDQRKRVESGIVQNLVARYQRAHFTSKKEWNESDNERIKKKKRKKKK